MTPDAAAVWSAIAATSAAVASFLIWRVQQKNLATGSKPEIVLSQWTRQSQEGTGPVRDYICFGSIKNVGRGVALHVHVNVDFDNDPPTHAMSTFRIASLAPDEEVKETRKILLWWTNARRSELDSKHIAITVTIHCWDVVGYRHETTYKLMVLENEGRQIAADPIAPGVLLSTRSVHTLPVSWLKIRRRISVGKETLVGIVDRLGRKSA